MAHISKEDLHVQQIANKFDSIIIEDQLRAATAINALCVCLANACVNVKLQAPGEITIAQVLSIIKANYDLIYARRKSQ